MTRHRIFTVALGLGIIAALVWFNHWLFATWFGLSYITWYLSAGAIIGLVSALAAMAWGDLDKHTGLISAHPLDYLGSCLQLAGLPLHALGSQFMRTRDDPKGASPFDKMLTIPLVLFLVAVIIVWSLVIAPLQYVVNLVCGAPARVFTRSERQSIARLNGTRLDVAEIGRDEAIPEGWWSASLGRKPVATTNLFAALVFLIIKLTT